MDAQTVLFLIGFAVVLGLFIVGINLWITYSGRRERIKNLEKSLRHWIDQLPELRTNMRAVELSRASDPLGTLVFFFDRVSAWQDHRFDQLLESLNECPDRRFDRFIPVFSELLLHLNNAGRNKYGWNRTESGETVTADNVWLGGVWGLFTHPVSYWVGQKDSPKGGWGHYDPDGYFAKRNAYDVLCDKANEFMASHTRQIAFLIDELERLAEGKAPRQAMAA